MATFCICGGGALGHVMAGVISSKGHTVNLLTGHPDKWQHDIRVTDLEGKTYDGHLNIISGNPADIIPVSQIVILCLPGYLINSELQSISPYITANHYIGSIVSSTGFFISAMTILGDKCPLFGFQRVPYIARVNQYGQSAQLLGYKKSLNMALSDKEKSGGLVTLLQDILDTPISILGHILEATLTNSNPILHPSRLYRLFRDWQPGKTYDRQILFYEEWDDETSRILMECDNEFGKVLEQLPIDRKQIPPLLEYYESYDAASLTRKIRSIKAFKGIACPMLKTEGGYIPDFRNRYFTEDIPYGLIPIKYIAQILGINTPVIDTIIAWSQKCIGKDYINHGILDGRDIAEISCLNENTIRRLIK